MRKSRKKKIRVPYNFTPRSYQLPFLKAMDSGYKRAVELWHRRAGKDKTMLNFVIAKAFKRVGNYYYYFPTASQGRKIIWQGKDRDGFPFMDHIPKELRTKTREDEMRVELVNGSAIQIIGTDKAEVVGPNPIGCVFSEYSLQNPVAWNFIRPILAENDGWAVFNYTPRGHNHGWDLYQMALDNPKWFCEVLTVDDTHAISQEAIQDERDAGMSEELIQQEFYCSFDYGLEGAYYLKQIARARKEGRITNVPVDKMPVYTSWDLGRDTTAIWFWQYAGQEIHLIDYYENAGEDLEHYAKVLRDKGYLYAEHYAPFDASAHRITGLSIEDRARELGIDFVVLQQEKSIEAGIEAVRSIFHRCWFDKARTKQGLNCLMNYHKEWDAKNKCFKSRHKHDWSSHGSDSFRYFARATQMYHTGGHIAQAEIDNMYDKYAYPIGM